MEEKKNRIYRTIMLIVLTTFVTFMLTSFWMYSHFNIGQSYITSNNENSVFSISNGNSSKLDKYLKNIKSTLDKYYLWKDDINEEELEYIQKILTKKIYMRLKSTITNFYFLEIFCWKGIGWY